MDKYFDDNDDYFDEDDEEEENHKNVEDEEEEDELERYMKNIKEEAKNELENIGQKKEKNYRADIDDEDEEAKYFEKMEEKKLQSIQKTQLHEDDDENYVYDENGDIVGIKKSATFIDPLDEIDHDQNVYLPLKKKIYEEHSQISELTERKIDELRKKLSIKVQGSVVPSPVSSFPHFNFDDRLIDRFREQEFSSPTPIQAQSIPIIMSGRDMIGIAETGSGKTGAYLWPAISHIIHQTPLTNDDTGPIVLIVAPTRELAQQIFSEAEFYSKSFNIRSCCFYGGGNVREQCLSIQSTGGCELLVGTPGRLIDMIRKKIVDLRRVSYLVFDEADKLFALGFEIQVRSIAKHVQPNRQCILFSATFRRKIEKLTVEILTNAVKVIQNSNQENNRSIQSSRNENIEEMVHVLEKKEKFEWLKQRLPQLMASGQILIFIGMKTDCQQLSEDLQQTPLIEARSIGALHGDMHQASRTQIINRMKKNKIKILCATDIASRGLDITSIFTVVNYDIARKIDTHIHRIGRTGRAGQKGVAYTLISKEDKEYIPQFISYLQQTHQKIPEQLLELGKLNKFFLKKYEKNRSLYSSTAPISFVKSKSSFCANSIEMTENHKKRKIPNEIDDVSNSKKKESNNGITGIEAASAIALKLNNKLAIPQNDKLYEKIEIESRLKNVDKFFHSLPK
ncbi:hypothetical protein SNEBB_006087 [Seison nebaliae]|nr:hypothetical protein SNEBB_006087 [Seison nebaliae]